MSELIISVSGLRGIVGDSLTGEIAVAYAQAFSRHLPPGPLILTRDGDGIIDIPVLRTSGVNPQYDNMQPVR